MPLFRKKPIEIEARKLTKENWKELLFWVNGGDTLAADRNAYLGNGDINITIRTLEGDMRTNLGDWIIRGVKGEFYPCKPDIFSASYDLV